jgi:hypothetical protein
VNSTPGACLALDDVVDFEHFRLARINPHLFQKRHQTLPERVELLARVPDLADPDVPVHDKSAVEFHPVRRNSPVSSRRRIDSSYNLVGVGLVGVKRIKTLTAILRLGVAATLPLQRLAHDLHVLL